MNKAQSLENPDFTYQYLCAFIPHTTAVAISRTVAHWCNHHGVEWTVGRLKTLKTQYLHFLANDNTLLVKSHKDGTPYGAFRPVWGLSPNKALQLLMLYSCETLKDITQKQEKKFVSSVESDVTGTISINDLGYRIRPDYYHGHPYEWISSDVKRAPFVKQKKLVSLTENTVQFPDVLETIRSDVVMSKHVTTHLDEYAKAFWMEPQVVRSYANKPFVLDEVTTLDDFRWGAFQKPLRSGKIGLIQERGAKLRAVANPFRHYQMVLEPLGRGLFDLLRQFPWDCTFDQDLGVHFVEKAFREGKTVHSIDLSDATNSYPLRVQVELVEKLINNGLRARLQTPLACMQKVSEAVEATTSVVDGGPIKGYATQIAADLLRELSIFEEVSRGEWSYKGLSSETSLRWTKGQPLGLYPSFAMFAVSHGLMLRNIEKTVGVEDSFRVLGDDVVITDERVAQQYYNQMHEMGCGIAYEKTLTSDCVAEFAGKVITKDFGLIPCWKWRGFSNKDVLGPLEVLGVHGKWFIPSTVRGKVMKFASLPEPVGIGLNPKGVPLSDRMPQELLSLWYATLTDCKVPKNYTLSKNDMKYRHDCFWSRYAYLNDKLVKSYHEPKPLGLPRDSEALDWTVKIRLDHIKTVNKSRLFPDDIELNVINIGSTRPDRGRPNQSKNIKTFLGRVFCTIRKWNKHNTGE